MVKPIPPLRRLWLATNGEEVQILHHTSRRQIDYHAAAHGLTVLKTDESELIDLVAHGATVTKVD